MPWEQHVSGILDEEIVQSWYESFGRRFGVLSGGVGTATGADLDSDFTGPLETIDDTNGFTSTAASSVTHGAGDATNPRYDLVFWDTSAAAVATQAGTPTAENATTQPRPPLASIDSNDIPLYVVYVPASAAVILDANIFDRRPLLRFDAWEHIDTQLLATTATSVSFASLSSAIRAFRLTISTRVQGTANVNLRLNNDSGGNYDEQDLTAIGAAVAGALTAATTQIVLLEYLNTAADEPGRATIVISKEETSLEAQVSSQGGVMLGDGDTRIRHVQGSWRNVADLINRIDVLLSAGNFEAGSRFTLEGLRLLA